MTEHTNTLMELASNFDIPLQESQATALLRHVDLLVEKNKMMNLTRITDPREALVRHVLDSLIFLKGIIDSKTEQSFLDIGTGGGFPGIPLGVMTSMNGLLIDSVGKKVSAVDEFIRSLHIDNRLSTSSVRAEELALIIPSSFDYVVARAVAEQNVLIEYASPLLKINGRLISSKALISQEEVDNSDRVAKICGLKCVSRETFELPYNLGHRELFVYEKVREPSIRLPRPNGMAKHKPL